MAKRKIFILLLFITFFSGCASTDEAWKHSKVEYRDSHAANQTLNYSVEWVDEATLQVLDQMEILIIEENPSSGGKSIKAATMDLDILIELKPLASDSTQMNIFIQYSNSQKSKTTANEIFYQTRQYLLSNQRLEKTDLANPTDSIKGLFPTESTGPSQSSNLKFPNFQ